MLDSMPDLVLELSPEGEYLDLHASEAARPVLERGGELGARVEDSFPPEISRRWLASLKEALATHSIQTVEYQLQDSHGINHFEARMFPAGPDKAVSIVRDITQRKRAEEALQESEKRYRSLVESFHDIVLITDHARNLLYANPSLERQTGYTLDDAQLASERRSLIHPEDRDRVEEFTSNFIASDEKYSSVIEHRLINRKGGTHWYSSTISKVEYQGSPALQLIAHDITARVSAEQALKISRRQLESLSRRLLQVQETERSQIARDLHDQLGQQLTALKLNLAMVAESTENPTLRQRLADSIVIVSDLLDETRNLVLELRPPILDDLGLIAALRWYTQRQAHRAGIQATFTAPDRVRRPSKDVESACFRIAQEAITNVLRHANAQQMNVKLEADEGMFVLTIRDDGVGFDLDSVLSDSPDRASMGTLGMQERASLAGGNISIQSTLGEGTKVQARFPLQESQPGTE